MCGVRGQSVHIGEKKNESASIGEVYVSENPV